MEEKENTAHEPIPNYGSQELSFEKVWLMFQETSKQFQETDKKFLKTDVDFQKTKQLI